MFVVYFVYDRFNFVCVILLCFFFFKQKTAYEMRISDWSSDVCSSDLKNPPDAILREVFEKSGDKPFEKIEDVISRAELEGISNRYKQVAGFDPASLKTRPSFL